MDGLFSSCLFSSWLGGWYVFKLLDLGLACFSMCLICVAQICLNVWFASLELSFKLDGLFLDCFAFFVQVV